MHCTAHRMAVAASFEQWLWARHSHAITFWFVLSMVSAVALSAKMSSTHPACWLQAFMSTLTFITFVIIIVRGKPYEQVRCASRPVMLYMNIYNIYCAEAGQ